MFKSILTSIPPKRNTFLFIFNILLFIFYNTIFLFRFPVTNPLKTNEKQHIFQFFHFYGSSLCEIFVSLSFHSEYNVLVFPPILLYKKTYKNSISKSVLLSPLYVFFCNFPLYLLFSFYSISHVLCYIIC